MTNKTFLEYVAEDILRKFGDNLARTAVVFPNKRASIFLNEHLARKAGRPIWSPAYYTISELFEQHATLRIADELKLIADLHKSFIKHTGLDETLDHFYGWGQLLLADFDDIDKSMADAHKVFANLSNFHEMDDTSYLSEEQIRVLRAFFQNFSAEHNSELKKRFLQLWSHFDDIYNDYRQRLADQQIAYEGMLFREVTENDDISWHFDHYIFVGFNLLQEVEQQLFSRLQHQGKAHFYWDFDHYYIDKPQNEAGTFVSKMLKAFPNELDNRDADIYDNLCREKHITLVGTATDNVQARYADSWLQEDSRIDDGRQTAIVMCDEHLLPSLIHSLPDSLTEANITTGYPLSDTPAASLVDSLLVLRTYPGRTTHRRLSHHPLAAYLPDDFRIVDGDASPADTLRWVVATIKSVAANASLGQLGRLPEQDAPQPSSTDILQTEAFFKVYTLLNRLLTLVGDGDIVIDIITLQRLVQQLFASTAIPFHGEPAVGVQVMGVLETRNLDFRHLLILSCNEGMMPKNVNDSSFIPHSIRKAFGLTTIEHKVAVYSYYFHRLLQRSSDITILYNSSTDKTQTGEVSRFVTQLMVESDITFKRQTLLTGQTPLTPHTAPKAIGKSAATMEKLHTFLSPLSATPNQQPSALYPTSINRYLRCQLQFYFNDILGLREPDGDEDIIDNRTFGNIFHKAAEIAYRQIGTGRQLLSADIQTALRQKGFVERAVDEAIREEMFDNASRIPELNGLQIINREVIVTYLRRLLEIDERLTPFTILGTERSVAMHTEIATSEGHFDLQLRGIIDRLDQVGDSQIRVVDYKTGARALTRKMDTIDEVFAQPMVRDKHPDYYLQTFAYAEMVRNDAKLNPHHLPVSPALLFIQHAKGDDYDPTLAIGGTTIGDIGSISTDFMSRLHAVLTQMFEPDEPFRPTDDRQLCAYCPYRMMCRIEKSIE